MDDDTLTMNRLAAMRIAGSLPVGKEGALQILDYARRLILEAHETQQPVVAPAPPARAEAA